jgi:formylglycine-generating enzyme required for sulfatase activity
MLLLLLACKTDPEKEPEPCTQGEISCEGEQCWVKMCGGSFEMGAWHGKELDEDELPLHRVEIPSFEILSTEVTVGSYNACVAEGACIDPMLREDIPAFCQNRDDDHPRGCLEWSQAGDVCRWLSGRLPSESEWEYAARNAGKKNLFPWGDSPEPSCELAILGYTDGDPCGEAGPGHVCSRADGNTPDGLCDMAGNIYEWVQDSYQGDYQGAPDDGSAWEEDGNYRILRGGGINSDEPVTTTNRVFHDPLFAYSGAGTRCVR